MINVFYGKKKFCLPERFNELSGKQLVAIAGLQVKKDQEDAAKLKALHIMLHYSILRFCLLPGDLKSRLLPFADFVFAENTLTEQLIPVYKNYYGPAKEFDNLTLAEFHETEINYQVFVTGEEDEKEEALNNLVATLYRKPKKDYDTKRDPDGDIRLAFNANELAFYSKKIAKWPVNVKLAILMYYDGCRQNLSALYDKIFSGYNTSDDNKAGMFGMMRGLAGTKYGDFDKVEDLNIHTALSDIEEQIEEAEEIERRTRQTT